MKIILIFLTCFILNANADLKAQNISFHVKNESLASVIKTLRTYNTYHFYYDDALLELAKPVTISVKNMPLEAVITACLKDQPFTYVIHQKTVILSLKKETQLPLFSKRAEEQFTIRGVIKDDKGIAIPGVSVRLKNTDKGTVSNQDGQFSLLVNSKDGILVFSYVGFKTQEISVGNQIDFNITMTYLTEGLTEVVVVGYGTQKKVNVTGAISTVDLKKQQNAPLTNASQVLQGVEGVYVNQAGGQPGRDVATIRIRGMGTLNNNDPLVLVNGIEFPLADVNPADIESVSVLKDAASAAIYGSRAANGVVLITTKSGKKGEFSVDYNYYNGNQIVNYLPDFVNDPVQFMKLRNQAQRNEGKKVVDYSDELIKEYQSGMLTDPNIYPNNRWLDIMFNPGNIQNHDIRFSGGAERITYSLSLNYMDQDGVLKGTDSKKYSLNYNTVAQIGEKLKVGAFVNGTYKNFNEPVAGIGNLMEMTFKAQAFHPTYLPDGRYANTFIRTPGHNVYRNPLALAEEGKNNTKQQQLLVNLFAEYKLPFNITYKINTAVSKGDDFVSQFIPETYTYQVKTGESQLIPYDGQGNRGARQTNPASLNTTIFNTLNWQGSFSSHNLKMLVGYSRESFSNRSFYARNEGYLGNDLQELNAGASNPAVDGSSSESRLSSFFGRMNYDFKEKYLAEINFRYDGSSRFASGNQWGFFPSLSVGWRLDKENFLQQHEWINELKLRGSIGQLGNERIALFRYVNLVALGIDYPFGSSISSGAAVNAYNDPSITWETTTIGDIGLDAAMFNNKLTLTVDVFKKRTTDILSAVTIPDQVGALAGPIRNIGTLDNTGLEINLGYKLNISNLRVGVNGGITYVKNKVVDLNGGIIYSGRKIITEGLPINSYYLLNTAGIFQNEDEIASSPFQNINTKPGYLKYQDANNDNVISEADRIVRGSNIPKLTYQFSLNLDYKGFSLNSFFQGVGNVYTYTENIGAMPFWFGTSIANEWVTDSWTPDNPGARLPILTTFEGSQTENFRTSSFWLKNAKYLRLKNIQLGYKLPEKWIRPLGIQKIQLFVNGQNLFTFSPMKNFDPEKNLDGSTFYEFPTIKSYTGGINVTF